MKKNIKIPQFKADEKTANGHIYPIDMLKSAIEKFNSEKNKCVFLHNSLMENADFDISDIRFFVNKLWLDESGSLNASVESALDELDPDNYTYNFVGEGIISGGGIVSEFKFIGLTCSDMAWHGVIYGVVYIITKY